MCAECKRAWLFLIARAEYTRVSVHARLTFRLRSEVSKTPCMRECEFVRVREIHDMPMYFLTSILSLGEIWLLPG